MATPTVFHERFGEVTRAQLAAYRKFNVSQSDHWNLADHFGEEDHAGITKFVKRHSASGMYECSWQGVRHQVGLDQIEDGNRF